MENIRKRQNKAKVSGGRWSAFISHGGMDIPFLTLVIILVMFGLLMLFSASYINSYYKSAIKVNAKTTASETTEQSAVQKIKNFIKPNVDKEPTGTSYIRSQTIYAFVGIVLMFIVSKINFEKFKPFAKLFLVFTFALLVVALFIKEAGASDSSGDFHRWIKIGPISFQPSEVAKFAAIFYCAVEATENRRKILSKKPFIINGKQFLRLRETDIEFIKLLVVIGAIAVLIMAERHLSGTILLLLIGFVMLYLSGFSKKYFVLTFLIAVIVMVSIIFALGGFKMHTVTESRPNKSENVQIAKSGFSYQIERVKSWLDKDYSLENDERYQTNQSLYAIGTGGFFGVGIGNSRQKYNYIPEVQNDFIFAVICEELGFFGALILIVLFVGLVMRGVIIAEKARSRFGALICCGIVAQVGFQAILNILVATDAMPNTGISLPFFSSGGSSIIMLLSEMGVVLSISRTSDAKSLNLFDTSKIKRRNGGHI